MAGLLFFTSPIGLGHAARDIAIAGAMGGVPAGFVSGGHAARLLRGAGFAAEDLYDPPRFAVRDGRLAGQGRWLLGYYRYYRECKAAARRVIGARRPRLVASDEDFASLAVAQEMGIPTVLVTDVLETRFAGWPASVIERAMNGAMREIIGRCDAVIMPERGEDSGNVSRVGPVVRQASLSRGELRERFSFGRNTVLVSVGGTDAGGFLIEKALEAAPGIRGGAEMVLAPGPSLGRAGGAWRGARDIGFVDNLHEYVFAADALVSLAGRSTIDEANAYGTPGVFIPIRGHFEQEDNARREGFSFGDVDRLADLVSERLGRGRRPARGGGAAEAGRIIGGLL